MVLGMDRVNNAIVKIDKYLSSKNINSSLFQNYLEPDLYELFGELGVSNGREDDFEVRSAVARHKPRQISEKQSFSIRNFHRKFYQTLYRKLYRKFYRTFYRKLYRKFYRKFYRKCYRK